jgi:hypothetical protein
VLAPPVPASVRGGAFAGVSPEVGTENTATENAANTDMGKWYDYILDYMSRPEGAGLWQTPASGVRALARAMSVAELGNESGEANYVGLASRVSKQIREQAHLSTGDKLGVDVAQSKF